MAHTRLTILGYWDGRSSADGAAAGVLIDTRQGRILLDCGSGAMTRLGFYRPIHLLDLIVLTRFHPDSMADLGILQQAVRGALSRGELRRPIPLLVPRDAAEEWLKAVQPEFACVKANIREEYAYAGAQITFFPGHPTLPSSAVRIASDGRIIGYAGACGPCTGLCQAAQQADWLLCGTAALPGMRHAADRGWMSAEEAAAIANQAKARRLVLAHADGDMNAARESAGRITGIPVDLTADRLVYDLAELPGKINRAIV